MNKLLAILLLSSCASTVPYSFTADVQRIQHTVKRQFKADVIIEDIEENNQFMVSINGEYRIYIPYKNLYTYNGKLFFVTKVTGNDGFIIFINSVDGSDCTVISIDYGKRGNNT